MKKGIPQDVYGTKVLQEQLETGYTQRLGKGTTKSDL